MLNRKLVYEFDALIPRNTPAFLLNYIKPSKGQAILDVGCGNGGLVSLLREQGCNAEGIDLSAVRGRGKEWITSADIEKTTLSKGKYDIIIASEILEHLSAPEKAVGKFHSALKEGGTLVIMLPKEDVLRELRFKSIKRLRHYVCDDLIGRQHLHSFTPASAKKMLSGFNVVKQDDRELHFVMVAKKKKAGGTKRSAVKKGAKSAVKKRRMLKQ
ncbi:MAG: class I SAM-dependent methyltransferase [Candidatus Diapherotrites archaeon]